MDLRKLKTLIDLVAESAIEELEVTEGESKVRIVKSGGPQNQMVMLPAQGAAQYAPQFHAAPAAHGAAPAPAAAAAAPELSGHVVKSPMVGTFYRSSSPGGAPFIDIGSAVKEGDTLCIIEAMKLLNEIDADISGTIKEICVENGSPVEFGQTLLILG